MISEEPDKTSEGVGVREEENRDDVVNEASASGCGKKRDGPALENTAWLGLWWAALLDTVFTTSKKTRCASHL